MTITAEVARRAVALGPRQLLYPSLLHAHWRALSGSLTASASPLIVRQVCVQRARPLCTNIRSVHCPCATWLLHAGTQPPFAPPSTCRQTGHAAMQLHAVSFPPAATVQRTPTMTHTAHSHSPMHKPWPLPTSPDATMAHRTATRRFSPMHKPWPRMFCGAGLIATPCESRHGPHPAPHHTLILGMWARPQHTTGAALILGMWA